jgi:hypothetical protein
MLMFEQGAWRSNHVVLEPDGDILYDANAGIQSIMFSVSSEYLAIKFYISVHL